MASKWLLIYIFMLVPIICKNPDYISAFPFERKMLGVSFDGPEFETHRSSSTLQTTGTIADIVRHSENH